MDKYNQVISNIAKKLEYFKEELIDDLLEVAINGELKNWAESVHIGEDFYFSKELFESLDDPNIKYLLGLIAQLEVKLSK